VAGVDGGSIALVLLLAVLLQAAVVALVYFRRLFINDPRRRSLVILVWLAIYAGTIISQATLLVPNPAAVARGKDAAQNILGAESFLGIALIFLTEFVRSKIEGTPYGKLK